MEARLKGPGGSRSTAWKASPRERRSGVGVRRRKNVSFNLKNILAANIIEIPRVAVLHCLQNPSGFLRKVFIRRN